MLRLAIRVAREQAEIVLAELLELAPSGVEEVAVGEDVIEFAVYGAPGELPELGDVRAAVGGALVEVSSRAIRDDWSERWREFHRPLVLGDRLTVRPPWEPATHTALDLVIDPGQAFGTGAHATTRLCLELMLSLEQQQQLDDRGAAQSGEAGGRARRKPLGPFIDLGCGSGVLAIAAAKLGWGPVLAMDYDPASVEAARANARANAATVEVRRHDLRDQPTPPADTIAANLIGPLLLDWARRLTDVPERLIASGLLAHEADRVAQAFTARGLSEIDRRGRGDWAALLFERQGR